MKTSFKPYEGAEPYIFMSYARNDNVRAHSLFNALRRAGYRVWYDGGLEAGINWVNSLAEHIVGCAVFMPLISSAFADSVFCRDEIMYALDKKRAILPVYLEKDVALPPGLEMSLSIYQSLKCPDAATFALMLDAEMSCAPCKDEPETLSQEAS